MERGDEAGLPALLRGARKARCRSVECRAAQRRPLELGGLPRHGEPLGRAGVREQRDGRRPRAQHREHPSELRQILLEPVTVGETKADERAHELQPESAKELAYRLPIGTEIARRPELDRAVPD